MKPRVHVARDPLALPEFAYRARIVGGTVGYVDSAGPTRAQATANVWSRYWRCWLGVDWPGIAIPDEALDHLSGQVAINGHRYALWRQVGDGRPRLVHWIMLNPSTANAETDDATMRRVCDFSARWGFGWVTVGNLWSYRATNPKALQKWLSRGGEWVTRATAESDRWVTRMAKRAHLVMVAWGSHGTMDRRGLAMLRMLGKLGIEPHALAVTRTGEPRHPLRLSATLTPQPLEQLRALLASSARGHE